MACTDLSWLTNPWFLGILTGVLGTLIVIAAINDIG